MTLYYFTATWCQPCKRFGPIMDEIKNETGVEVKKVDIDVDSDLAGEYNIMSVPTVVHEDDKGMEVARITGAMPKAVAMRELHL